MSEPADNVGLEPVPTDSIGRRTIAHSFELTARRITATAAGVGDLNPAYFDDTRRGGLVGHPGLIFAMQWNTRHIPDQRVSLANARRSVHTAIDARFERALRQGDVITCQGEVTSVRQVRSGVLSTERFTMVDSSGERVVELDTGGIVRGAVTNGPDREGASTPPLPDPGDLPGKPRWLVEIPIARGAPHVYTECADIWNPIHTERSVALGAGLPDIILHGTATMTLALRELIERCLEERVTAEGARELFFDVLNHEGAPAVARGVCIGRPA